MADDETPDERGENAETERPKPTQLRVVSPPKRGKPFAKGNRAAVRQSQSMNPIDLMRRRLNQLYFRLLRGKIEAPTTNALVNILRLQLELMDRFEIGEKFAQYESQISELEARFEHVARRQTPGAS